MIRTNKETCDIYWGKCNTLGGMEKNGRIRTGDKSCQDQTTRIQNVNNQGILISGAVGRRGEK